MLDAYADLLDEMKEGEQIEAIVFGDWGWEGYGEPVPNPVPTTEKNKVLTIEQAKPYMKGWSFNGGTGAPQCYAVRIWTNQRVLWATQYDGDTHLDSAPRNPIDCVPDMPGG
jgi:hypothetical protein